MISPSSLKIIEAKESEIAEHTEYDTLYHICNINGTKSSYYSSYSSPESYDEIVAAPAVAPWGSEYISIDSIDVDSIRIKTIKYPSATSFNITYDASNAYGAIIREKAEIIVVGDSAMTYRDYFDKYSSNIINTTQYKYSITFKDIKDTYFDIDWFHSSHLH